MAVGMAVGMSWRLLSSRGDEDHVSIRQTAFFVPCTWLTTKRVGNVHKNNKRKREPVAYVSLLILNILPKPLALSRSLNLPTSSPPIPLALRLTKNNPMLLPSGQREKVMMNRMAYLPPSQPLVPHITSLSLPTSTSNRIAVKIVPVIDWIDNFSSILSGVPMKTMWRAGHGTRAGGCLCLV